MQTYNINIPIWMLFPLSSLEADETPSYYKQTNRPKYNYNHVLDSVISYEDVFPSVRNGTPGCNWIWELTVMILFCTCHNRMIIWILGNKFIPRIRARYCAMFWGCNFGVFELCEIYEWVRRVIFWTWGVKWAYIFIVPFICIRIRNFSKQDVYIMIRKYLNLHNRYDWLLCRKIIYTKCPTENNCDLYSVAIFKTAKLQGKNTQVISKKNCDWNLDGYSSI